MIALLEQFTLGWKSGIGQGSKRSMGRVSDGLWWLRLREYTAADEFRLRSSDRELGEGWFLKETTLQDKQLPSELIVTTPPRTRCPAPLR